MTASAAQTTPEDDANPRGDLAQKIDHLLKTKHPENRGPYSMREAASLINKAAGDEVISHSYLGQLRSGKRDNPTMRQLAVLSAWFGVDVGYFFPDEISHQSAQNVDLADAIKDPEVRDLALSAAGLPKVALKALRGMVDTFWTLEKRARGQRADEE
jgi:transcriptional regulator with XRE-family HTH domain